MEREREREREREDLRSEEDRRSGAARALRRAIGHRIGGQGANRRTRVRRVSSTHGGVSGGGIAGGDDGTVFSAVSVSHHREKLKKSVSGSTKPNATDFFSSFL